MNDALEIALGRRLKALGDGDGKGKEQWPIFEGWDKNGRCCWGGLSPNMSQKWGISAMCCGTDVRRVYFSVATSATDGDE